MNQKSYAGVSKAAWGSLFLYLNINLGSINILPNFMGYLLMLGAIADLKEENRDFLLLRPLGILLTGWHLAEWVLTIFGISLNGKLPVVQLIVVIINLYFSFQLYTDFAGIASRYQETGERLDRRILICRNIQAVLTTFLALPIRWDTDSNWSQCIMIPVILLGAIAGIALMLNLFSLRRLLQQTEDQN